MQKKHQNTATKGTSGTNRQSGPGNRQSGSGMGQSNSGTGRSGSSMEQSDGSNQSGNGMNRSGGNDSSGNRGQSGNRPGQSGKEHNMRTELSPEQARQAVRDERREDEEERSIPDDTDPELDEQDLKENNLSVEGADKIEWDPES
ncbi:MAG: hypothetical protein JST42_20605 [Bacteroidetes bacterium]|nr:hypothetical protein [Bacteroidota bacterium]